MMVITEFYNLLSF